MDFLRKPPVDRAASLRGDKDVVRDRDTETSLTAGDAALLCMLGTSIAGGACGDGWRPGFELETTFFSSC